MQVLVRSFVTVLTSLWHRLKKDITSSADVQIQAQPTEHKPYKQSIFDTVDKDVSVFIRATGWATQADGNFHLVFDSSPPYEVLFMVHQIKETDKWVMKLVHRDGNKQALATGESNENGVSWQVAHNAIQIGKFHSLSKQ